MLFKDELTVLLTTAQALTEKYSEEQNKIIAKEKEEANNKNFLEQVEGEIYPVVSQLEALRILFSAKIAILDLQISYLQNEDAAEINYTREFWRTIVNIVFSYTDLVCARDNVYRDTKLIDIRSNKQKKLEIRRFLKNFIQTELVVLNKKWQLPEGLLERSEELQHKIGERDSTQRELEESFDMKTKIMTCYQDLCYRLVKQDGEWRQQGNNTNSLLQKSLLTNSQPILLTNSIILSNAEINDTSILVIIASCLEVIEDLQILMDEFSHNQEVKSFIKNIIEYPKRVLNPDNLLENKGAIAAEIAAGLFPDGNEFMVQFRIKALTSKYVNADYKNWLLGEYNTRVWNDAPADTVTEQKELISIVIKDILCATEEIAVKRLNKCINDNLNIEDGRFILNHFTMFKDIHVTSKQDLRDYYKPALQNRINGDKIEVI